MSLSDYVEYPDHFELESYADSDFVFPCCKCRYEKCQEDGMPCRECGHNDERCKQWK